uniref:Uncharacterized protein n=1 Tax=Manihot esculenta TaxID=3983 RepID=A0A2C9USW6_MANES
MSKILCLLRLKVLSRKTDYHMRAFCSLVQKINP